jgi:hypothetical protein
MMERVGALEAAKAALADQLAEQAMRLEMVQGDYVALQVSGVMVCVWGVGCVVKVLIWGMGWDGMG